VRLIVKLSENCDNRGRIGLAVILYCIVQHILFKQYIGEVLVYWNGFLDIHCPK
jgi:hypothetical protein